MNRLKELSELKYKLSFSDPFMYIFFSLIGVEFNKAAPTACLYRLNNFINIGINPDFWDTLQTNEEKLFIIKHEMYHLILKHVTSYWDNYDKDIMNISMDLYINYLLSKDSSVKIVKGGCYYNDPNLAYLKLTEKIVQKGTIDIYDHIIEHAEELKKNLIINHEWESFLEKENNASVNIDEKIKQAYKTAGTVPYNLKNIIDLTFNKYKKDINYKTEIRSIVSNIGFKSYNKRSILKDSNFYPESDGFRTKYKGTIPIIVDTSGSMMNQQDIVDVCDQLVAISKQSNLCLKIVECDASISKNSVWVYKNKKDLTKRMKNGFIGGGGTNVDPGIAYVNQLNNVKIAIYITDGYVSPPTVKHNYKLLVVLTKNTSISPNEMSKTWGTKNYKILKIK